MATAGEEAATAEVVVASTEEVSAVAVSTAAVLVVDSMGEASAVAVSTAAVISVGDVSAVAVSMAVAFVAAVLVGATSAITDSPMMSSSEASAFRGRGAIRMDITVTTITRTTIMDTAGTHTVTMGTVAAVTDTAMAADQGISEVFGVGDKPVRLFEIACPLVRLDQVASIQEENKIKLNRGK